MAAPITARSTRWSASAPIEAPTSSTTDSPRKRRPQRRDRRPLDARQGLEIELRHRHQRAGIAARYHDVGVAFLDRVDGEPHRGFPPAIAQGLARLILHPHGDVGVDEFCSRFERWPRVDERRDQRACCRRRGIRFPDAASAPSPRRQRPQRDPGLPPSRREQCGPCLTFNDLAVLGPVRAWRRKGDTGRENNGSAPGHNCVQRPCLSFSPASAANGPGSGLTSCGGSKTAPGLRG